MTRSEPAAARELSAWPMLVTSAALLLALSSIAPQFAATGLAIAALVLAGTAATIPAVVSGLTVGTKTVTILLATAAVAMAVLEFAVTPIRTPVTGLLFAVIAALAAHAIVDHRPWSRLEIVLVIAVHAVFSGWLVANLGTPDIDVYLFQQEGSRALIAGMNPYELRYENIYGPGTPYYADEIQAGDRLTIGYIYPPLALFGVVPGFLLLGDYRYALIAASVAASLLLLWMQPTRYAVAAAALLTVAPLNFAVYGWNEPMVGLFLALVLFAALRRWPVVPLLLGIFVGLKQYVVLAIPLALVLLRDTRRRHGALTLLVVPLVIAGMTAVPFLALEPASFVFSVVVFQILQPFRTDSSSIPGVIAALGGPHLPAWVAFVAAAAAMAVVLWRAPRTPPGFAVSLGVVFLAFLLFSKQAFPNYYLFSTAAFLGAAAAHRSDLQLGSAAVDAVRSLPRP